MPIKTETRSNPQTHNSFLRFQVGTIVKRPIVEPDYAKEGDGYVLVGHIKRAAEISVFKLLGYGATEAEAMSMAAPAIGGARK